MIHRHIKWFLLVGLLLSAISCGPTQGEDKPLISQAGFGKIGTKLEANHSRLQFDQPLRIRFTLQNLGKRVEVIESKDKPVFDIAVGTYGEMGVWSAQNPDKVLHRLELQPNESYVVEWTWVAPKAAEGVVGYYVGINAGLNTGFGPFSGGHLPSICVGDCSMYIR